MKKTVLIFGVISGVISSILMLANLPFMDKFGFDNGLIIGYTAMVISFSLIFFGIRSYRKNQGAGFISFGKAFKVGILIALIMCLFYVATWEVIYFKITPDFWDKYSNYQVGQMRKQGAAQEKIDKAINEAKDYKKMYDNPFYNAGMTFMEPLPVGLLITLISAAILRKKRPVAETVTTSL